MIRRSVIPFWAVAVLSAPAIAQDPRAIEVLKAADSATKQVKACTYDAEFYGEGGLAQRLPHIRGRFMMRDGRTGFFKKLLGKETYATPSLRATLTVTPREAEHRKAEKHLDIASDGKMVTFIEQDEKYGLTQAMPMGEPLLDAAKQLYMIEFLHPTPFSDEIGGRIQKYEGEDEIAGVICDRVYVEYQQGGLMARWWFGKQDHIPRRVDRIFKSPLMTGSRTLLISNLNTRPDLTESDFRPAIPAGFTRRSMIEKWESHLLRPGAKAPAWKLKRPDGTTIRLSDLKGKIVVIEFWATWCSFCKATMPEIEKLHQKYDGDSVKFVSICCWDDRGDVGAAMKSLSCTFDAAVQGDKVAEQYKVQGLPTYYVIDGNGLVVYAGAGAHHADALEQSIKKAQKPAEE